MGMKASEIEKYIKDAFPDAEIEIRDLAGDDNHYAATITSSAFKGKSRVAQHQMVYAALKGNMGGVCMRCSCRPPRRTRTSRPNVFCARCGRHPCRAVPTNSIAEAGCIAERQGDPGFAFQRQA